VSRTAPEATGPDPAGARRTGRPRSTEADRAILDAARAALVELGWGGLSMADVAARAGVAKTTLYRRWPSKNELVLDAVADLLGEIELPDLGSLRADLTCVVRRFAELLERPETQTALMAIVAESTRDPALRRRVRTAIVEPQRRLVVLGRQRAQARGELPADAADPAPTIDLIFDVVAGAVVHRTLVSGEPVDDLWAERFTTLVLTGLSALQPGGPPGL
jgi:AcrR family transcriptional regulator